MATLGTEESLVELPAINYMQRKLGYDFVQGDKLTPQFGERQSFRDVILASRLETALRRLNPWMENSQIQTAVHFLSNPMNLGASLLEINEKIHKAIVDLEFTVKNNVDGQKKDVTVKFIDFENLDNNDYLVTRQYEVQGINKTCYPDIVVFINGIPIVVIECKSPFLENQEDIKVGKREACKQLRRYMNLRGAETDEGIERLFYTNFFTGIFNKYHAYAGTISCTYDYYLEWKDPYPFNPIDIEDVQNNGQNLYIQGLLEKNNLLTIMQHFIVFDSDEDSKIKKLARYQQFRAVVKAVKRIKIGNTPIERGGVIWHTQGSGKSLTMVMLARMIRRIESLKDSTLVVVTDRTDLDKQIFKTFANVFPVNYTKAESNLDKILTRAETVEEMLTLLSKAQAKIIMTTIQKFQSKADEKPVLEDEEQEETLFFDKEIELLSNKSNIIVFTDEAHRSQYNNFSRNMRKALPSATFIGFTGTPLEKEDKNTYQTFGKLIDKYTISEAVADGETVAIVYEARRQDLHIITDKLEEEFESYFHNKTDIEKEEIKKKFINKLTLAEADDRIEDIAIDILKHYRDNIYPSGFKAQIVCVSRHACVKYYNSIKRHMKEILGEELEAQIIYSCENNEAPELVAHRTTKFVQDELIKRYKLPIEKDELCFLIVKDMLITGFDAPVEQVMYLDRPLKEHGLLQAIARVNRTYTKDYDEQDENGTIIKKQRTKNYGFVVDYFGITRYLADALSLFDKNDLGEPMKDMNALYQNMLDYKEAVMRMFTGVDRTNIDAIMNVLKPDNKRAEFEFGYKRFGTAIDALMPSHVTQDDLNTLKWLTYIKVGAKARFEPQEAIDISDCGEKAKELVIKHLKSMGVYQWISPVTLFDKDYKEKLDTLKSDEAVASSMEHAIKHTLAVKMKDNPVRFTSLFERLQKLLDETKNNWEARRQELKQFIEQEMEHGEEDEANRLGFKEKRQLAIFETIKIIILKDSMELVEDEAIRQITFDCIDVIKKMKVSGFEHNQTRLSEIETAMFEMLLTKHYSEIGYEKVTQMSSPIIDLAKIHYSGED